MMNSAICGESETPDVAALIRATLAADQHSASQRCAEHDSQPAKAVGRNKRRAAARIAPQNAQCAEPVIGRRFAPTRWLVAPYQSAQRRKAWFTTPLTASPP